MFRKILTLALIATLASAAPGLAQAPSELQARQAARAALLAARDARVAARTAHRNAGRCNVSEVAAFPDRTHILCDNWAVPYAAVPTDGSAFSVSVVQLALFAMQSERSLSVRVSLLTAQNPPGCLPEDCRRIESITIAP